MKTILDIDGFLTIPGQSVERESISVHYEEQSIDCLFEQYYLGLRSSMFIYDVEDESDALFVSREWRKKAIKVAMKYAIQHTKDQKIIPPDFLWITRDQITEILSKKYPNVNNISLLLSMRPRLSARVISEDKVTFPALSRSMFNHFNLVIINSILGNTGEDGNITGEPDRRSIARWMLPYLLFCHDNISVKNLPYVSAHSKDAIMIAQRFTTLQTIFIIAHEFGHILLNHHEQSNADQGTRIHNEHEADLFALKVVHSYVDSDNGTTLHDAFTAIRWLFKYQLLEESVGVLSQGRDLDFEVMLFEERRGNVQLELLKKDGFTSSLFEMHGFITIVELQSIIYDKGKEFINYVLDTINKSNNSNTIEPWWEKIVNK